MSPRFFTAVLILSTHAFGASFETGAVIHSDGAEFFRNTIPQVARLGNDQLFTVWSASAKKPGPGKVYGSFSTDEGKTWSAPKLLMSDPAKLMADPNILVDGDKVFVFSTKVNLPNKIDKSWTIATRSDDNGATWSDLYEIPIPRQYVAGKQHNGIVLRDGTYLVGIAWDKWPEMGMVARTEGEMDLTAGVLASKDGKTWTLHGGLHATYDKLTPGGTNGLCEPSLVELDNGEIFMLLRSGSTHHYESRSGDGGLTWSTPKPSSLPGHNTPTAILRLREDPREIVAVWNNSPLTRYPLSVARSSDGGKTWSAPRIIAKTDGLQVSYPGVTQASDGTIVAVWQQALPDGGRDIRYARFKLRWIITGQ
jgi:predicted neuraminidase